MIKLREFKKMLDERNKMLKVKAEVSRGKLNQTMRLWLFILYNISLIAIMLYISAIFLIYTSISDKFIDSHKVSDVLV